MKKVVKLCVGGDVMLGRIVKEAIRRSGPDYPLGQIAPLMRKADLTLINLECAITSSESLWPGEPKAFYFGAPPEAVQSLLDAGVDLVSLANNHLLDYGFDGLEDTLRILKENKIRFAGGGSNLEDARKPAYVERKGIKIGMVAYCDHQGDFAAGETRPGIAYLDLQDEFKAFEQVAEDLHRMRKEDVDWPILSLHWGPNMVHRPSNRFVRFAHAVIDSGYKILFGHSAHVFHGIEIYHGCPIFYSAGDLVDDYYVDPEFKNDHQLLFEVELTSTELKRIILHPVFISDCHTVPAKGEQFEFVIQRIIRLSEEMGTNPSIFSF